MWWSCHNKQILLLTGGKKKNLMNWSQLNKPLGIHNGGLASNPAKWTQSNEFGPCVFKEPQRQRAPFPWTFYSVQRVVSSAVMFALYPFPQGLTWEHFAKRPFHTIYMCDGHYWSTQTLAALHWKLGNEEGLSKMHYKRLIQHTTNSPLSDIS